MSEIKVVHLTSVHRATDVRIFSKECKTLACAGYQVTVIAPHDCDETRDGVTIRAVPRPRSRRERFTCTIRHVYEAALRENAEVYHIHDLELLPTAWLLHLHGKHVIYDVHESYPDTVLTKQWIPSAMRLFVSHAVRIAEYVLASSCDRIVAAVPAVGKPFPPKKTAVIHNFPEAEFYAQQPAIPYCQRDPVCVYAGGISLLRGVREMIDAVGIVPAELGCRLALVGDIASPLLTMLADVPSWKKVDVLGWQSRTQVSQLLSRSRVGLCVLHPTPNHLHAFPIKLFEYMSAGLPVIASDFPLYREIVLGTQSGLIVNPLDASSIAAAITWILRHADEAEVMGRNGQRAVIEKYSWERESATLLSVYADVAGASPDNSKLLA